MTTLLFLLFFHEKNIDSENYYHVFSVHERLTE